MIRKIFLIISLVFALISIVVSFAIRHYNKEELDKRDKAIKTHTNRIAVLGARNANDFSIESIGYDVDRVNSDSRIIRSQVTELAKVKTFNINDSLSIYCIGISGNIYSYLIQTNSNLFFGLDVSEGQLFNINYLGERYEKTNKHEEVGDQNNKMAS